MQADAAVPRIPLGLQLVPLGVGSAIGALAGFLSVKVFEKRLGALLMAGLVAVLPVFYVVLLRRQPPPPPPPPGVDHEAFRFRQAVERKAQGLSAAGLLVGYALVVAYFFSNLDWRATIQVALGEGSSAQLWQVGLIAILMVCVWRERRGEGGRERGKRAPSAADTRLTRCSFGPCACRASSRRSASRAARARRGVRSPRRQEAWRPLRVAKGVDSATERGSESARAIARNRELRVLASCAPVYLHCGNAEERRAPLMP
jgi:hypothetical protein